MAVKVEEFAPETIVRFLTDRAKAGLTVQPPCSQTLQTVVVFADICGFTALSERFAQKGGLGSENLGFFLNRCAWCLLGRSARECHVPPVLLYFYQLVCGCLLSSFFLVLFSGVWCASGTLSSSSKRCQSMVATWSSSLATPW